jgi:hypothetical protein
MAGATSEPGAGWHINKRYQPVGFCIYCGATSYTPFGRAGKLGDEHIVPLNIGGNSWLPQASCQECEDVTSAIEQDCAEEVFATARAHLRIKGRKRKRPINKVFAIARPLGSQLPFSKVRIPVNTHHGLMYMIQFTHPPQWINGADTATEIKMGAYTAYKFDPNAPKFIPAEIGYNFNPTTFCKLLAKIAHAYTCAEFGPRGFVPILSGSIRGIPDPIVFVGGNPTIDKALPGRHSITHQILQSEARGKFIQVSVRLFSDLGMPIFHIVSGLPLTQSEQD